MLNYRDGPLSAGTAGHVHGGDRLPWAPSGGGDNFEALKEPVWQIHVYGTASAELAAWCDGHGVPLHRFDWSAEHETVGFARDGLYLVRPDSYVALADASGSAGAVERYLAERNLRPWG
jgi:hypothetical protein